MKKIVKKNLIVVCSVLAVSALATVGVSKVNVSALTLDEVANNFYVVDGASVLYNESQEDAKAGIRFQAVMTEAYYAEASTATSVKYGIELYSALNDTQLTDVDCTENVTLSNNAYTQDAQGRTTGYVFNASIHYGDLTGDTARLAYAFEMYAKAYVQVDGGTKQYASTNQTVRSMSYVAKVAYNDSTSAYYQAQGLEGYFSKLTVAEDTVSVAKIADETDDRQIVIDGLSEDVGAKKVYIGTEELEDAVIREDTVILSQTDAERVNAGQNYALSVLSDSGNTYSATFDGITKYLDDSDFVSAMQDTALNVAGNYFKLDGDVALTEDDFNHSNYLRYWVASALNCTLDGNGYTLSVNADFTGKEASALFYDIKPTSVTKNLVFKYNAKMSAKDYLVAYGASVNSGATIKDCYMEANVVYVEADGSLATDKTIAMFNAINKNSSSDTTVKNLVVKMDVAGGKATFAKNTSGNVTIKDCVYIGEETPVLPRSSFWNYLFYYSTTEDFIAGANGKKIYQFPNASAYLDSTTDWTNKVYTGWNEEWFIKDNVIKLGGVVANAELPARTITASVSGNALSVVSDTDLILNAYDIYAGETLVATIANSCNVASALEKAKVLVAGENAVEVTVKTAVGKETSATATANVFGISDANFVTVSRTAKAELSTSYYIMIEDVELVSNDFGSSEWPYLYVSKELYISIDGNGHTLEVTGELKNNNDAQRRGPLFRSVFGTVCNLVFKYDVSLTKPYYPSCFARDIKKEGNLYDCYMEANITLLNANEDTLVNWGMIENHVYDKAYSCETRNIITKITILNKEITNEQTAFLSTYTSDALRNGRIVSNCIMIGDETTTKLAYKVDNLTFRNCYKYATLADFCAGDNGKYLQLKGNNDAESWTDATAKAYTSWGDVWTIDETGIKLCGVTVYTVQAS